MRLHIPWPPVMALPAALAVAATASAFTLANSAAITIDDAPPCLAPIPCPRAATPYPATIDVSGVGGVVADVNVTLNGFSHGHPDDVDVLLVGPDGTAMALVMSDAGGGTAVSGLAITLDDQAAAALPDERELSSGTFRPTDY